MTINDLINMLNEVKAVHPEGGLAEVFYEIPLGANHRDYADISTFGMGECGAVLLK